MSPMELQSRRERSDRQRLLGAATVSERRCSPGARPSLLWRVLTLGSLWILVACGDETSSTPPSIDFTNTDRAVIEGVFGDGHAPETVVARVGTAEITVRHVAYYLDLFPGMSVEAAVEDLVDLTLASAALDEHPYWDRYERDARVRGRALAWMRHHIWLAPSIDDVSDDEVDAYVNDPANLSSFGTPELVNASHILVRTARDATNDAADPAEVAARLHRWLQDRPTRATTLDLPDAVAAIRAEGEPPGIEMRVERDIIYPERYSGPPSWEGAEIVAEPFGQRTFAARPGDLLEPFSTEFGYHVVFVEDRIPANLPSMEERRELAREAIRFRRRATVTMERMQPLFQSANVTFNTDHLPLISREASDRIAAEAELQGDRFRE